MDATGTTDFADISIQNQDPDKREGAWLPWEGDWYARLLLWGQGQPSGHPPREVVRLVWLHSSFAMVRRIDSPRRGCYTMVRHVDFPQRRQCTFVARLCGVLISPGETKVNVVPHPAILRLTPRRTNSFIHVQVMHRTPETCQSWKKEVYGDMGTGEHQKPSAKWMAIWDNARRTTDEEFSARLAEVIDGLANKTME
jgi:hypothetical protein